MIPVKLSVKGLYSYRNLQVIEFDKLLEGQVFGIFGGVGSGKSSILEAISFVLYDQSERLNQKDKRNYNMLNLKSDEFLIDFIFRIGADAQYRFKVSTTRKKNKEEVNPFVRETYRMVGGEWVAEELNAAEIVGLSYENFKRTIIIPQGKFQEFLQLTDGERVKMMKEIFQLEKFDLSDKVGSLISQNKLSVENLNGQLAGLEHVSLEIIEQKESLKLETGKRKNILEEEIKELETVAREQYRLRQIYDQWLVNTEKYRKLESEVVTISEREQRLNLFETVSREFGNDIENKKRITGKLKEVGSEVEVLRNKIKILDEEISGKSIRLAEAEELYNTRDQLRLEYEDLEIVVRISGLNTHLKSLQTEMNQTTQLVLDAENEIKKWEEKDAAGRVKLEETRKNAVDLSELYEVKSWYKDYKMFSENISTLEKERNLLRERLLKIETDLDKCVEVYLSQLPELNIQESGAQKIIDAIRSCIQNFENDLKQLRIESEKLLAARKLEEIIVHLHDGQPCPLCGSQEHPDIMNMESVATEISVLSEKRNTLESKIELLKGFEQQVATFNSNINANQPLLSEHEKKSAGFVNQLEIHKSKFSWKKFENSGEDLIAQLIEKELLRTDLEKKIVAGLETVRLRQEEARKLREELQNRQHEQRNQLVSIQSQIDALKTSLRKLNQEDFSTTDVTSIRKKIEGLKLKYIQVESEYRLVNDELNNLKQQKEQENGKFLTIEKQLHDLQKEATDMDALLHQKLTKSDFADLSQVVKILERVVNIVEERKAIQNFREQIFSLKQQIEIARVEIESTQFSPEKHDNQLKVINEKSIVLKDLVKQHIELEAEISTLQQNLLKKEELKNKAELLNIRAENLKTIGNLFRGHGFVNYISTRYMVNLCNAANERFYKLTRQQLRLEVSENNDFVVRDFLNNGRVRSVKTLSGGQTFQASLCLALALADNIRHLNKSPQNFFFLDEGFGTLDKDALRMVFETLKSLRKENRIVGIISHVEELQQEIDVYLTIKNDTESGSIIERSWEN